LRAIVEQLDTHASPWSDLVVVLGTFAVDYGADSLEQLRVDSGSL
jgi:hypothetical protein